MYRRKPVAPDPDRYIPTSAERLAQEIAVLGGTAGILEHTLELVVKASIRGGLDHNVGGYMFIAVKKIHAIDADGAHKVANHLFELLDDIQMDQHPWTVRYAVPFLRWLIRNSRNGL